MSLRRKMWLILAVAGVPIAVVVASGAASPIVLAVVVVSLIAVGLAFDRLCLHPLDRLQQMAAGGDWREIQRLPTGLRELADRMVAAAAAAERREAALVESDRRHAEAVREMHHRVKNNMQIVASLVHLQAGRAQAPELRSGLASIRARIGTLAILHRHLYEDVQYHTVDLRVFLTELRDHLETIASDDTLDRVLLEIDVPPTRVVSDQAVALGLIVTEAVSNALRHGFPDGRRGTVRVSLAVNDAEGHLTIADDGIGLGVPPRAASLGRTLMSGFAKQMDGELSISDPPGTTVTVRFAPRSEERERSTSAA